MIDKIIVGIVGIISAIVAYAATDTVVKEKTGKHIYQHVAELLRRIIARAEMWLTNHPGVESVFLNAKALLENKRCALLRGAKTITAKVKGYEQTSAGLRIKNQYEEKIPLDAIDDLVGKEDEHERIVLAAY